MTELQKEFHRRLREDSDIVDHLPLLFTLATTCDAIVEFGVRSGNSTIAFLAGLEVSETELAGGALYSYDFNPIRPELERFFDDDPLSVFQQADTLTLTTIPVCTLLFIDTLHTADQVRAELKHHDRVDRWIALHDTVLFGQHGENGGEGIMVAIDEFLRENPIWEVRRHYGFNNGLMLLERHE